MDNRSVVILGLPSSGKTTYLAALWHLVLERDVETRLKFDRLRKGDNTYLNNIAHRWRSATIQERTSISGGGLVSMDLKAVTGDIVNITFPDLPGEAYRDMWETRACTNEVGEALQVPYVLLFIHGDNIAAPLWVIEEAELTRRMGMPVKKGDVVQWLPRLAPTQVQIVALLQLLRSAPLDVGPRKLAIMLSAWDKASLEGFAPLDFVANKFPLLHQYLTCNADGWEWNAYGISAQGGDYDPVEEDKPKFADAERMRDMDHASHRIKVVSEKSESHDLTEPLEWLMQ